MQEQIILDENELNVFEKKSLDDINVTEKRVKAWLVLINYNESNEASIKSILDKSGYKTNHNEKKLNLSESWGFCQYISAAQETDNFL